jgi:DNA-binding HxlR family transcriptional regulator
VACCDNGLVPTYSDAPLPVGLDSLVGMGMNRVKLAIAVALADNGGSLSTPDLVAALGGELAGTTIARNLHELEDHGFVTGDLPREDRRRRRTRWTLNHVRLNADLGALVQATTPMAVKVAVLP